jgi:hypothetical protein
VHHTTNDVLGQAAYLRRSCEIVVGQLRAIDGVVNGAERLTPVKEAEVGAVTQRWAEGARDHVELASQYVRDWHQALFRALSMEPDHLH